MSKLSAPTDSLIFGSFLYHQNKTNESELMKLWKLRYQADDLFYPEFNPLTKYYAHEMGEEENLKRFFVVDVTPVSRDEFVPAKLWSTKLEQDHSQNDKRIFNLDIGLINLENFLLATGKPYTHRIYLSQGVYADLTLVFEKNSYRTLPWTYPDYAHEEKIHFLNSVRQKLKGKLYTLC